MRTTALLMEAVSISETSDNMYETKILDGRRVRTYRLVIQKPHSLMFTETLR